MLLSTDFSTITCCNDECGVTFAMPNAWIRNRKDDHEWWYCPNGHQQHWPQESDEEKLRRKLEQAREHARRATDRAEAKARSAAAYKGQVTRIKKRVSKGVCPCCKRTFKDLAQHMEGQHPEWTPEDDAMDGLNVVRRGGPWYDIKREGDGEVVAGPIRGVAKAHRLMAELASS